VKLRLIAIGARSPEWVSNGFNDYVRRVSGPGRLELLEIPAADRKGWPVARILADEGARILARVAPGDHVVALDVDGRTCSTEKLSQKLEAWRMQGNNVNFLVGGADGLHQSCLNRADEALSLSALTFPHQLVRIILAEQLYRAWTILHGHPYHRA
jgi:23S rRNA (pseudouridine1915-N3)-methyltransferase